ncbi:MAG TPA: site-specific integrase [Nitrospirota bacterium]|nr:site-specific integrase [Nitrospirota bacterium]
MSKVYRKWIKTRKTYVYYLDYTDQNKERVREATDLTSKVAAEELLNKRLNEVSIAKHFPERVIKEITFSDFVDNHYLPFHAKGLSPKHFADLTGKSKVFKEFFGNRNLRDITSEEISGLLLNIRKKRASNTFNNYRNAISGIFTKAIEWKYAAANPVTGIKMLEVIPRRRILEPLEQTKLLDYCCKPEDPHLHDMVLFDLRTGLRYHELKKCKWEDINVGKALMRVVGKGGKERFVDLDPVALKILERQKKRSKGSDYIFPYGKDGGPVRRLTRSFKTAVRLSGIGHTTIHDLRRTAGANWINAGIHMRQVQEWMGHESIKTTQKHYGHLFRDSGKNAIKKMG